MRILLFVDDMAIFTDSTSGGEELLEDLKKKVAAKYNCSPQADANVFLGMAVEKIGENMYRLNQERYINDILAKYKMEDVKPMSRPSSGDEISVLDCPDYAPGTNPLQKPFAELIGILRWVERCTRPDLTVTLSELGKVQCNPAEKHMKMLKDLLRYVATTKHMGIVYGKPDVTDASGPLVGYVDASWGEPKCRGGYIFNAWRSPIAWSSYKLTATALSSAESEYMSAAIATQEALWLRYLASDLGYGDLKLQEFGKLCERDFIRSTLTRRTHKGECPITIFEDNKACIQISQNPVLHKRSRHIHLKYHFLRYHYSRTGLAGPSGRSAAARSDSDDQKNDFRGFSEKKKSRSPRGVQRRNLNF